MSRTSVFQPNWISAPGGTIADLLQHKNLSKSEFAEKIGQSVEYVQDLINGSAQLEKEVASKLEEVLGLKESFWLTREKLYRENQLRLRENVETKWIKTLPIRDMIRFGWINESNNIAETCLKYFGVPDIWTYKKKYSRLVSITHFRRSTSRKYNPDAISAWIRQGEIQAEKLSCKAWNPELFREKLIQFRKLVKQKDPKIFLPILVSECAECGVALVIAPTPTGCAASGATKFIKDDLALMMLSFRYKSDDHFWFTFFHEAGHLLTHTKDDLFIEESGESYSESKEEEEANEFAFNILIPPQYQEKLKSSPVTMHSIKSMAKEADISLGVVVGQLQHFGLINFRRLNKYKRYYKWEEILSESYPPK